MTIFLSGKTTDSIPYITTADEKDYYPLKNVHLLNPSSRLGPFLHETSSQEEERLIKEEETPMEKRRTAIFRPNGEDAYYIFFPDDLPAAISKEWKILETIENKDFDKEGGFKIISVFFMIALKSGDLVDGYFRGIKLKYLCFGTTKLSSLFDNLKSLVGVQGVMQESYAKSVSFDAIAPDQDPSAIKEQGKYFMDVVKLPWMKPGVGFVNQGSSLDRNKTIDENKLTSEGVIYCEAYQPGNGLTAYPKGDPGLLGGINWFDAVLDIVTSLAGSKSGTSTGR